MTTQVVITAGNVLWTTDKVEFNAVTNDVTYQVFATALGTNAAVGNLYANAVRVPAGSTHYAYVGAGNYQKAQRRINLITFWGMVVSLCLSLLLAIFPEWIVYLFINSIFRQNYLIFPLLANLNCFYFYN